MTGPRPLPRAGAGRVVAGALLSALSAALLTLSFPPFDLWPLIGVGFVPMLLAQYRVLPPRLSSLAPALAIGGWFAGFMLPIFLPVGTYMLWLPLGIAVLAFLVDRGNRAFHERTRYRWFVLLGALSWVGIELLRSFVPIMATWGFVGYTLYDQPWLIQPVSIFGIFGLDLLLLLINFALALAGLRLLDRHRRLDAEGRTPEPGPVRAWLVGTSVVAGAWIALSLALFRPANGATVRVAALHFDAGRPRGRDGAQFAAMTREAAGRGARVVVWPEMALDYDPREAPTEELPLLAVETNTFLVLGYFVPGGSGSHRNEATVLSPQGEFLGVYGKDHPVVFLGEQGTRLGTYPVYDTSVGRLATVICYDLDFTDTSRAMARNGAQLIAAPSLDGPSIAAQHYGIAVFRAAENRLAIVKSDSSGSDSAIIDPYGRILERAVTPGGGEAVLVADVPLGGGGTIAMRLGDWVGWGSLAGWIGLTILTRLPRRKTVPGPPPRLEATSDGEPPRTMARWGASRAGVWAIKHLLSPLHRWLYRASGGAGITAGDTRRSVLLLTTTGRRTGKKRTTPVFYLRDGDRVVICNANPGHERPNPWVANLLEKPIAGLKIGREVGLYRARRASQAEMERLWPALVEIWPAYQAHFERSGRIRCHEPSPRSALPPATFHDIPMRSEMTAMLQSTSALQTTRRSSRMLMRPMGRMIGWAILLFAAVLLSIFLHEVGHGVGARIEGVHISTGFNQVGGYDRSPDDPDFRSQSFSGNVLGGLLGPLTSWALAAVFTLWLYRFGEPSWAALTVGALAVVNGLARAVPMLGVLFSNLQGRPHMEDEVGWAIWAILRYCHPASISGNADFHTLLATYPDMFLREAIFWILPLVSLAVSLALLIAAYRRILRLWAVDARRGWAWLFVLLPLAVRVAASPVLDVLDRLVRINW